MKKEKKIRDVESKDQTNFIFWPLHECTYMYKGYFAYHSQHNVNCRKNNKRHLPTQLESKSYGVNCFSVHH